MHIDARNNVPDAFPVSCDLAPCAITIYPNLKSVNSLQRGVASMHVA